MYLAHHGPRHGYRALDVLNGNLKSLIKTKSVSKSGLKIDTQSYGGIYYGEFGTLSSLGVSGTVISVYVDGWGISAIPLFLLLRVRLFNLCRRLRNPMPPFIWLFYIYSNLKVRPSSQILIMYSF